MPPVTPYGSYEFLVMPFGIMNALATFCILINKVPAPFIDLFVVSYLDDIIINNKSLEEHVGYLQAVFRTLRDNELYINKGKCFFAYKPVLFWVITLAKASFASTQL